MYVASTFTSVFTTDSALPVSGELQVVVPILTRPAEDADGVYSSMLVVVSTSIFANLSEASTATAEVSIDPLWQQGEGTNQ